jgi:hypothetical protein
MKNEKSYCAKKITEYGISLEDDLIAEKIL